MKLATPVKKTSVALLFLPLLASLFLTGCGGDPKPDASAPNAPTSAPTTTAPTTSPTTAPDTKVDPNIPAAARAHTPAGAEAFVKYFFQRMNVAWTSPKAGIVSPLCQTSSKACAAYEKTASRLIKEGHRYDGSPVTIKFIGVLDATNPDTYDVLVTLVQERRSEVDSDGRVIVTDKRKNFKASVELLYTGHAWSVATIKIMK
jgi:hypothetical protein